MMGFVGQLRILFFILREMEAIDGSEARKSDKIRFIFWKVYSG